MYPQNHTAQKNIGQEPSLSLEVVFYTFVSIVIQQSAKVCTSYVEKM